MHCCALLSVHGVGRCRRLREHVTGHGRALTTVTLAGLGPAGRKVSVSGCSKLAGRRRSHALGWIRQSGRRRVKQNGMDSSDRQGSRAVDGTVWTKRDGMECHDGHSLAARRRCNAKRRLGCPFQTWSTSTITWGTRGGGDPSQDARMSRPPFSTAAVSAGASEEPVLKRDEERGRDED